MSATEEFLAANRDYAAGFAAEGLAAPPRRKAAVVACMDARIDVFRVLGLAPGDAHVIRNAGGVVTDDVLRSLFVSQQLLGTEEVVLLHHTGCGMAGLDEAAAVRQAETARGARPPFPLGSFADVAEDLRAGMTRIREAPYLPHRQAVRGFIYDVETGRLNEVS